MTQKTIDRWNKEVEYCFNLAKALAGARSINLSELPLDELETFCEKLDITASADSGGDYVDLLLNIDTAQQLARELRRPLDYMTIAKLLLDIKLHMSTPEEYAALRTYNTMMAMDDQIINAKAEDQLEAIYSGNWH
jgi:hypothetical protein